MFISDSFVWRNDHYAFHITNTDAIEDIRKEGLKPLCGKRSQSVCDDTKGVFFFDYLGSVSHWIDVLYENKNIYELELLRFNLKNRKWILKNENEFYLTNKVKPEKIEYLRILDKEKNIYLPLIFLDENKELIWYELDNYKPLIKTKK